MPAAINYFVQVGEIYGRWTVTGTETRNEKGIRRAPCRCACGTERQVKVGALVGRQSLSCGCIRREKSCARLTRHGGAAGGKSAEYQAWRGMKNRCLNPKDPAYPHYGGRGIRVGPRWLNSFANFLADMGPKPSSDHSLHRVNDGDYDPETSEVVWATPKEQARDRRNSHLLTVDGETRALSEWAEIKQIPFGDLVWRDQRGWPPERMLDPVRKQKNNAMAAAPARTDP